MRVSLALRAFLFLLTAAFAPLAVAHEGHDHNTPATAAASTPRGEAASDDFQLVAVLRGGAITIYLDRLATNEPVTGAQIEVETPAGQQTASANEDGTYRINAAWAKGADHYDLIFTVTAADKVDILPLTLAAAAAEAPAPVRTWMWPLILVASVLVAFAGGLFIARRFPDLLRAALPVALLTVFVSFNNSAQSHEGHDHNDKKSPTANVSRDVSQRLPDGTIFVPKSVQRLLTIRTMVATSGDHSKAIELPGRIIPDPNASGYVQSTLAGRLLPPPNGFPLLGSRVEKGQVLAYVSPPIQQIDVSDMRQKEGELLQQIAIVERRVARFEKLIQTGAVPQVQLDDARAELQGLRDRKASLDQIRREPEVLIAPVSGTIAEINTIAGQLAQPNTVVFQIVDTSRLWVEALSFDSVAAIEKATARNHAGKTVDLVFRGSGAALRNQSIPVHFAIEGATNGVAAGQFVTVFATLPEKQKGILLPRAAVVRSSNGQHVIFEHVSAERFRPREVKMEVLDAENVLVTAGIADGKRVVVQGAELIEQVR